MLAHCGWSLLGDKVDEDGGVNPLATDASSPATCRPSRNLSFNMSYLDYWQLETSPYRNAAASYPAPSHQEAQARIDYLASEGRTLGALIAPQGTGKSSVLQAVEKKYLRDSHYVALVDAYGLSSREFLWQVACAVEAQPTLGDSVSRLWQRLADAAAEHVWRREQSLILVDDAGQAGVDLQAHLVRLVRLAIRVGASWHVVLSATAEEATRWPEALRELIDLRIELHVWEEETTIDFLQHALMSAGRLDPVFTEDALYRVHQLSQGVPRVVSRLADAALVAGAATAVPIIDSAMVESALQQANCSAMEAAAT